MKKDKFKQLRFEIQTCEAVNPNVCCAMLLSGMELETPDQMRLSFAECRCREVKTMEDGTLIFKLEAKGICSDNRKMRHLRMGKQAKLLDYGYFKSRLSTMIITSLEMEIFNFRKKCPVPFTVNKLELFFGNGKRIDLADHISIFLLDKLAA